MLRHRLRRVMCFFFSSRRRHTRWTGDWSSDVCSSDLGQVLPSLGETSVLLSTMAGLYPGITATAAEPPEVAVVKGSLRMVRVIATAVRDRQQVPASGLEVTFERDTYLISKQACAKARERARRSRRPHNQARHVFVREMLSALTRQVAGRLGANVLGEASLLDDADIAELRQELRADPGVRAAIGRLWPVLTPQQLLAELYSSPQRLAAAAPRLTPAERALLLRGAKTSRGGPPPTGPGPSATSSSMRRRNCRSWPGGC